MQVRRCPQNLAIGADSRRDAQDQILQLLSLHLVAGKQVESVRTAVIQIEEAEGAASDEEKSLFLSEPQALKIPLKRGAGALESSQFISGAELIIEDAGSAGGDRLTALYGGAGCRVEVEVEVEWG